MKWYYSILSVGLISMTTYKQDRNDYKELFATLHLEPQQYDKIYLMHFDFCSPVTKCKDTAVLGGYLNDKKHRIALIVDTLNSSEIPDYISLNRNDIFFVNRIWIQRKGLYTEYQQQLKLSKKGLVKKRKLLK